MTGQHTSQHGFTQQKCQITLHKESVEDDRNHDPFKTRLFCSETCCNG